MPSLDEQFVSQIESIVDEHLGDQQFGVELLGREAGVSRGHLHKRLKKLTGLSPSGYIRRRRLLLAKDKLERKESTVAEIGYQVGFSSPSYFSTCFKEEFGYPPGNSPPVEKTNSKLLNQLPSNAESASLYRPVTWIVSVLVLAFAIISWGLSRSRIESSKSDTIAVLPFENLNNEKDDFLSRGLTEDLIATLARYDLQVAARKSVFLYSKSEKSLQDISQELNVRYLVEGSIRKTGSNLRVTASLIDPKTSKNIWSRIYNKDFEEIFDIQNEIAAEISAVVGGVSTVNISKPTSELDIESYQLTLQGRYHLTRMNPPSILKAKEFFEKAIRIDSQYAPAWSHLAHSYVLLGQVMKVMPDEKAWKSASNAVNHALDLDPGSSKAHWVMGSIKWFWDWDFESADYHFQQAISIDPQDSHARVVYGLFLAAMRNFEEGLAQGRQAVSIDPMAFDVRIGLAEILYYADQPLKSMEICESILELDSTYFRAKSLIRRNYRRQGNLHALISQLPPDRAEPLLKAIGESGIKGYYEYQLRQLMNEDDPDPFLLAFCLSHVGNIDESILWLNKSYEARDGDLAWVLIYDGFTNLYGHPEFELLLHKIGYSRSLKPSAF